METRKFGIQTKITASKTLWNQIDEFISEIERKDIQKEINCISISKSDIIEGILSDNCILFVGGKDYPSFSLQEKVMCNLATAPEWARSDLLPRNNICLWTRK